MAGNYNLGSIKGTISIDYDGKGVVKAKDDIKSLHKTGVSSQEGLNTAARGMAVGGAIIAAGFAVATKAAVDFDKGLSAIQAVSGATAKEMEVVRAKALKLGADTAFSATDAAGAIEELVKAGVSIPDVMNGAADATVALAAAGGVALPEAATLAANAMNAFNLKAQDMPKIADLIAGAANASAIDVGQFGQSLAQVGATANLVGLSFADTAAAIALMGNAGIKGSDAGTSLKTMLSNLQPQTNKQKALFDELGITTEGLGNKFFDAQGHVQNMATVAQVLQDATKGMTDQQKAATLETIFGSDAIRAAAVVTKAGASGFNQMATAMGKVSAADVAKTRMGNLAGQFEQLKGPSNLGLY
jgi:TP901 family phage tail tape measure protein